MFIAMVVAFVLFGTARGHDMQWVMNAFENAVKSIAMVILIIGAGGVLEADPLLIPALAIPSAC